MSKTTSRTPILKREFEIKQISKSLIAPSRAKIGSVGYDLTVPENFVVPAHSRCKIPLGFAINLPIGVEAKIEPRSGCSLRGIPGMGKFKVTRHIFRLIPYVRKKYGYHHFDADVLVGKIDPNYTDEVNVLLKNHGGEFTILAGTRIAQMTFYNVGSPFFKFVKKLSCKSRGGGIRKFRNKKD